MSAPAPRSTLVVAPLPAEEIRAEPLPEEFSHARLKRSLLALAGVVLVVVAAVTLLPGLGSLRESFAGAQAEWLVLAGVLEVVSCLAYVVAFRAVFCRRMSWRTSAEIGFAELGANSLLSLGGAGGLVLGAWILRRGGVPGDQIGRRTVAFFLLTSLASVGFLVLGGVGLATGLLSGPDGVLYGLIPAAAGLLAIAGALLAGPVARRLAARSRRPRAAGALRGIGEGVDEALRLLRTSDPGLIAGTAGYLLADIAVLGVCFVAFGHSLPALGVLLVAYIVGQLGGLIPLPGGIGGVDGGLIGALVLYGAGAMEAAVAVLAYRGLLLAIPAALGLPALAVLRRRLRGEAHDIAACAPGQEVEVLGQGTVRRGPVAIGGA